ncbi:MAG: nucleotide exchange factor GrpE, partial [Verrucomicrobiae bacterium]|nr:nucleotide exchange factor GrpE [Verrucomicrobiae bacterium]
TALAESQNAQHEAVKVFYTGVAMIHQQLRNVLESAGLEEIDARDKPFDPTLHEAIAQYDTTEVPDGHVFRQIRKGYKLNGRLIRPAGVIVARKPAAQQPDQPATEPIQTTNPGVEHSQTA